MVNAYGFVGTVHVPWKLPLVGSPEQTAGDWHMPGIELSHASPTAFFFTHAPYLMYVFPFCTSGLELFDGSQKRFCVQMEPGSPTMHSPNSGMLVLSLWDLHARSTRATSAIRFISLLKFNALLRRAQGLLLAMARVGSACPIVRT
jgi:hypothetical protein